LQAALEDGRHFLARQLIVEGKREQALKAFSVLKSSRAALCRAKIFASLAAEASSGEDEAGLLDRAQRLAYQAQDRLNCQTSVGGSKLTAKTFKELSAVLDGGFRARLLLWSHLLVSSKIFRFAPFVMKS
jgi:hypothetical protein